MVRLVRTVLVSFIASFASLSLWAAEANIPEGHPIGTAGFNEMLSKQIKPGTLSVEEQPDGSFLLTNKLQTVSAQVTRKGVTFDSIGNSAGKGGFSLELDQWGREGTLQTNRSLDIYKKDDAVYHAHTDGLAEKFTNTSGGIQQDFIIPVKPEGPGNLQIQLQINGAKVIAKDDGAIIQLNSGRQLTYDRLNVTDRNNKKIPAHIEIAQNDVLKIIVQDTDAQYPITVDPTIGDANWVSMGIVPGTDDGTISAIATFGSNVYIGGAFTTMSGVTMNSIAKWDGSSWSSLGGGAPKGSNQIPGAISSLVVDKNGNLYAGGSFITIGGISANSIAMWDGTTWTTLSGTPSCQCEYTSLTLDNSGNLYSIVNNSQLEVWNGSQWSTIGIANSIVRTLALDNNGLLYVAGAFTAINNVSVNGIAIWNGSSWASIGANLNFGHGGINTIAFDKNNQLIIGGNWQSLNGVEKYLAYWDGSNWISFGAGIDGPVYSIALDANGNIFVGGQFAHIGNITANGVAEWDGTSWYSLADGNDGSGFIDALAFDVNGNLYAGGTFTNMNNILVNNISRWNGTRWSSLPESYNGINGSISSIVTDASGNIYIGGRFTSIAGEHFNNIAKWNGQSWISLGSGVDGAVFTLATDSNNNIYAGGGFLHAGNTLVNNIAMWNGSAWSALGSGVAGDVYSIAVDSNNNVYAGGGFNFAGGVASTRAIAMWNGSSWVALGTDPALYVYMVAVDKNNNVYIEGTISTPGLVSDRIAQWNGSTWSEPSNWNVGGQSISAIKFDNAGNLYVAGNFTTIGGSPISYLAEWNGSSWNSLGNFTGITGNTYVSSLSFDQNGNLYVGGSFSSINGVSASNIAKWDGTNWFNLGSGVNGSVSLLASNNGNIFVVGGFNSAGLNFSYHLAMWSVNDSDGDGVPDLTDCFPQDPSQWSCPSGAYPTGSGYAPAPAGMYAINGVLFNCPAGTYNPNSGASNISACLQVPAGSYSLAGAANYLVDPAGSYSGPSGILTMCPGGTYNPDTGSTSIGACIQTPAGYYSLPGAGTATLDPTGTYSPAGASSPTNCPAGTYNPNTGGTSSTACLQDPAGTYSLPGASVYIIDPPGTYSSSNGLIQNCPAGTYNPNSGSTSIASCIPTPAGSYSSQGAASPTPCSIGFYSSSSGSSFCYSAPSGTYVPVTGASAPTQCPSGTYNYNYGSTSISACIQASAGWYASANNTYEQIDPPGSYSYAGAASPTPCPAGTYNPNFGGASISACLSVPAGSYSTVGSANYTTDPAGTYSGSNGILVQCPAGTYNPNTGSTDVNACVQTPAGSYSVAGSASYTADPAGTYSSSGAGSPTQCPAGTYNPNTGSTDVSACVQTPAGTYSPAGSTTPTQCPAGSYQPSTGASSCITAPAGTYVSIGGAITPTICPAGTYNPSMGSTSSSACMQTPAGSYSGPGAVAPVTCPAGDSSYAGASSSAQCFADADGDGLPDGIDANSLGAASRNNAGIAVVLADMDSDGYADILVGSPGASHGLVKEAGSIRIISGATGQVINTLYGTAANQHFGSAFAVVLDQYGVPDLVVGNPSAPINTGGASIARNVGNVSLYSGATGALIQTIANGTTAGERFGSSIAVGDVNGDNIPDLIIGSPMAANGVLKAAGKITVFNGLTSTILYTRSGTQAGEHFGAAAAFNSLDKQLLVGSSGYDDTFVSAGKTIKHVDAGRVEIFDATDLTGSSASLFSRVGDNAHDHFGASVSSFSQDITFDAQTDWAVGIPGARVLNNSTGKLMRLAGKVQLFSGFNNTPVTEITGANTGDNNGSGVSATGDINGDGINDLAIGVSKYDVSTSVAGKTVLLKDAGKVEVVSGSAL